MLCCCARCCHGRHAAAAAYSPAAAHTRAAEPVGWWNEQQASKGGGGRLRTAAAAAAATRRPRSNCRCRRHTPAALQLPLQPAPPALNDTCARQTGKGCATRRRWRGAGSFACKGRAAVQAGRPASSYLARRSAAEGPSGAPAAGGGRRAEASSPGGPAAAAGAAGGRARAACTQQGRSSRPCWARAPLRFTSRSGGGRRPGRRGGALALALSTAPAACRWGRRSGWPPQSSQRLVQCMDGQAGSPASAQAPASSGAVLQRQQLIAHREGSERSPSPGRSPSLGTEKRACASRARHQPRSRRLRWPG